MEGVCPLHNERVGTKGVLAPRGDNQVAIDNESQPSLSMQAPRTAAAKQQSHGGGKKKNSRDDAVTTWQSPIKTVFGPIRSERQLQLQKKETIIDAHVIYI